ESSAAVKIEAVRGFGATVDLIDTEKIGRNERVTQLAQQMPGAYHASAYDDDLVIAGNSTLGEELASGDFDAVVVPVGGGGLVSGIILGLKQSPKPPDIYAAEPLLANDATRSFQVGSLIRNETEPQTIADGARTISLGIRNWPIIRSGVKNFIEVPEQQIAEAVRLYYDDANLKCEPTGALSLGAVLIAPDDFRYKKVCLVVSGGNVDANLYKQLLG
ncbi:MAG: serine dehydratase, partial [Blastocatellia bacterium]